VLGFFKKKMVPIVAPVEGKVVPLEEVNDEVFSTKLAGEGVAIIPQGNLFVAPVSGVVTKIFATNHAFSIQHSKALEIMVHIGLDTVTLEGVGFERLVQEGERVEAGDAVIKVDLEYIQKHAKDSITPIVILDDNTTRSITPHLGVTNANNVIMEVC
jgi:glucose-specific phosphotransferase system IIA component